MAAGNLTDYWWVLVILAVLLLILLIILLCCICCKYCKGNTYYGNCLLLLSLGISHRF